MTTLAHKPHQTVIFSGSNDDSWSVCGLLSDILFIDEAIQPEMNLIAEDDFSIKVRIIFKFLVVKRLQFLRQFDFVRI